MCPRGRRRVILELMPTVTLASLFDDPPPQWGLPGDSQLWRELAAHFASTPMPVSEDALVTLLHEAFAQLAGGALDPALVAVSVSRYPKGGRWGGAASAALWRNTAFPLLRARYRKVAGPHGADGQRCLIGPIELFGPSQPLLRDARRRT